jgi:membrane protein YqaA with SNARE-associated domain
MRRAIMVIGAAFLRVDDASLFLVVALVIVVGSIAGGIIAYLDDRRARRKTGNEQEHPHRAA